LKTAGVSGKDLAGVLLTHGHEDHDGGLSEIVQATRVSVKAHKLYDRLIRLYPDDAPPGVDKDFPASCWRCPMPASFSNKQCRAYHRERSRLEIETIGDGETSIMSEVTSYHLPGHSPDALVFLLGEEVLRVGDTLLPEISPHPTRQSYFGRCRGVRPAYPRRFHLRSQSLSSFPKTLEGLNPDGAPDHTPRTQVVYNHRWNEMAVNERVRSC
jgi:glyoxylase-like metal-dependent hydrolase (beta-lactamase superfamily II)